MHRLCPALLQGFCTSIYRRTRGHYIIDQQNAPTGQPLSLSVLKSVGHVTKPICRCQIRLRGGWSNSAEYSFLNGAVDATGELVCQDGRLVISSSAPPDVIERNRYDAIEALGGIFGQKATM
jgi:hypothetical protein